MALVTWSERDGDERHTQMKRTYKAVEVFAPGKLCVVERPMIETVPLEQAADGYARMMQGKARFRMVLVTKEGVA
jgi:D-arabinose 1-dehydrogenase-like Zn-dependent alcohol dehydrogenase